MIDKTKVDSLHGEALARAADQAVRAIPPAFPLTATVAVNPFLGQLGQGRDQAAALFARIAGVRLALPRRHYAEKIAKGEITDGDLAEALRSRNAAGFAGSCIDPIALKAAADREPPIIAALPTIADLSAEATGKDWPGLIAERIGNFAAGYFDEGQALWAASRRNGTYAAWRAFASHDLTPEIAGLKGFATHVADTPEQPQAAIARAAVSLGLGPVPGTYFHQLLLTLGGWAQYARHFQFKAELDGKSDTTALELLAIRLIFEEALYLNHKPALERRWQQVRSIHAKPPAADTDIVIDGLLQVAAEHAAQRKLAATLAAPGPVQVAGERPLLQAAFCIDVRSEPFRRALESLDPGIATLGFAGFFGLGIGHKGFASDLTEHRLPVLLTPSVFTCSAVEDDEDGNADRQARVQARAIRAWGRFKLAAVSSFAFVEAMGPVYLGKLLRDGLGFTKTRQAEAAKPHFSADLDLDRQSMIAETVLRAMSFTDGFARTVLLVGHGANVVNNPYASALHCGACGGYAGDVNARLLADLLNRRPVRARLAQSGIAIPDDTVFLAGLHDTTTDKVTLFDRDLDKPPANEEIARIGRWLALAGELVRAERSQRLPRATPQNLMARSADWSEVRPELGLAGCRAFLAAPRARSAGRPLDGQVFLHDYVWRKDEGFKILELILTAPVVVASWISLQYFGSALAPAIFGSGNKLLHNVVGGIGVFEGNGGILRAGLPWQSLHDGVDFVHEPLRLSVAVEAPKEAMTDILRRHPELRALFDNGWLHLFALDDHGVLAWRYSGDLGWSDATAVEDRQAGQSDTIKIRRL